MTTEDQRQEYRLDTQLSVFLEVGNEENHESSIVISRSLDISANGLRIITDRELPLGSILRSCIQNQDASKQFTLITEVKWQQAWKNPEEFLVGLALFESEDSNILEWKEFIARECHSE
jgi:hypothetical protein